MAGTPTFSPTPESVTNCFVTPGVDDILTIADEKYVLDVLKEVRTRFWGAEDSIEVTASRLLLLECSREIVEGNLKELATELLDRSVDHKECFRALQMCAASLLNALTDKLWNPADAVMKFAVLDTDARETFRENTLEFIIGCLPIEPLEATSAAESNGYMSGIAFIDSPIVHGPKAEAVPASRKSRRRRNAKPEDPERSRKEREQFMAPYLIVKSLSTIAKDSGVDHSSLHHWSNARSNLRQNNREELANYLGVHVEDVPNK